MAAGALLAASALLVTGRATSAPLLDAREAALLLAPGTQTEASTLPLLQRLAGVERTQPLWPVLAFLRAEQLRRQGLAGEAATAYRSLVEHAAADPYRDTWGAHGLTAFALYRWLQWHAAQGGQDRRAFEQVADAADRLLETRLGRSAFRSYAILSSVPLLEEQLYRALALEARRVGLPQRAAAYYLNALSRARSAPAPLEGDPLYALVLEQGTATPDRVALLRAKRLVAIGQPASALTLLAAAEQSQDLQVRLEAAYLRARAARTLRTPGAPGAPGASVVNRAEAQRFTDGPDGLARDAKSAIYAEVQRYATRAELAQAAALHDALQFAPGEEAFAQRLQQALRERPDGAHAAEVMHWLAWGARVNGRLETARGWLLKLRSEFPASPLYARAAVELALAGLWRGQADDLGAAAAILDDLLAAQPSGDLRPQALFWLGRIAEQQGRTAAARQHFERAAAADLYGFHGLRARMHLASGAAARGHWLVQSPALRAELRAAREVPIASPSPAPAPGPAGAGSVYRQRVEAALALGLYRLALDAEPALRRLEPARRVQDMDFESLDASGLLAPIAVAVALRQDALAAADADAALSARLALAQRLGAQAADWPGLLSLVHPVSVRPVERSAELMRLPGYARAAYPVVYAAALQQAEARHGVPAALLYAVMRQESFFYPAALSSARALGLFQFMPGTFADLNRQWQLLGGSGPRDAAAYLMDEALSIDLGARWFAQKLLPATAGSWPLAALAHHSGAGKVAAWRAVWKARGWDGDVEMLVDSFRMPDLVPEASDAAGVEGREFARRVVADYALVDALGLYAAPPAR